MQIVTDKNKVALYFKDNAISYKEFILNTKKIKQYTNIKEFKLLFSFFMKYSRFNVTIYIYIFADKSK